MANDTSGLSNEVKIAYDKVFLSRAEFARILDQGSQKKTQSTGEGKTIWFNRYTPSTLDTTALSEGVNPDLCSITATNVSVVLAEYGGSYKISKFLSLTSIDGNNREKISLAGQWMGEKLNRIVRTELENGTALIANAAAASAVATSDTLDAMDLARVVTNMEINKAMPYDDGFYMGKFAPRTKYDLMKDTTWINAKTYSDVKQLYKGEMGELYQVRCLLNVDANTSAGTGAASTVTMYHNYIHGKEAFGTYDLSGDQPKMYILANQIDSYNPTGRFSIVSWAGSYGVKVLNSSWLYVLKAPTSFS